MKILHYILTICILCFFACSDPTNQEENQEDCRMSLTFIMDESEFVSKTKVIVDETIRRIDLLVFDKDGLFIEKVQATNINLTQRTFKASVQTRAKIIHAIANMNSLATLNVTPLLGQSEQTIIPPLQTSLNELIFWGRSTVPSTGTVQIEFIRNQAKVSVVNNITTAGIAFAGFAIRNYNKAGSVAPFINGAFTYNPDIPSTHIAAQLDNGLNADDRDEKYICEYSNPYNAETFVILKFTQTVSNITKPLFYKVFLRDNDNMIYPIVRNVNYRVIVKNIPTTLGASTFTEALTAPPINSLYAEIIKEAPLISDINGNSLKVTPLTHIVDGGGSITSIIETRGTLGAVRCDIIYDPGTVITNLTFSNTQVSANIRAASRQQEAKIRVRYGKLERIISIFSSPIYSLKASTDRITYNTVNTPIKLTISIDTIYPSAIDYPNLYPIKCYIKANNLSPVDNKDMFIDFNYVKGEYWYTYLAQTTGNHVITFKTNFTSITNDEIVVRSAHFTESKVILNKNP
ncbi:MAG: FimB/Mfa2 family fimbrial subunit [Marinifilaceae bacterium]